MIGKSKKGPNAKFELRAEGAIVKQGRLCVPSICELKNVVLEETHSSAYAMNPKSTKMYRTLKKTYWWPCMKWEIVEYVDKCLICQHVKLVRQGLGGLLNPLPCQSGSSSTLLRIFCLDYPVLLVDMMTYG